MYLQGGNDEPQLGIVDAIMAVATLKSLFGFGKKKAALKQIDANAKGQWTGQFPPYADWQEFINRKVAPLKKKGAEGTDTHAKAYDFWRKRKDSILIKNQIASPEDYGAWIVATYGLKDGWIKPSAKPGDPFYNNGPFAIGTQIPIFDYEAIVKWAEKENAKLQPTQPAAVPVQLTPQTVKPPTLQPLPQIMSQPPGWAPPAYAPTGTLLPSAPQPVATPAPQTAMASMLPLALLGVGAIYFMTRKKGRR